MKLLVRVVLLVASVTVEVISQRSDDTSLDQPVDRSNFYCSPNSPNFQMKCSDDCESMVFCYNGNLMTINCLAQTGKKYCDMKTNTCSDRIDVCHNSRDFCPDNGIYPDLKNCSRYVYCDGKDVYSLYCEHNTIWDYASGSCVQDATCKTFTTNTGCGGNKYSLMVKHPNPRWFVFCNWGRPLLGKCQGSTYTFDEESGRCRFQCGVFEDCQNGKYVDEFDNSIYYDCYKLGNKWSTFQKKCPEGMIFIQWKQICVRKPEVETPTPIPWTPETTTPINRTSTTTLLPA